MKKLAVIGWPIEHSLSPKMHTAALKKASLDGQYTYEKVAVEPDQVSDFLDRVRSGEFVGINVTIPHKISVFEKMDALDSSANLIGACNTVARQPDGTLRGYNTDAFGAFGAIQDQTGEKAVGKHVLILGAGGAARACAAGAALNRAAKISILNRTVQKAEAIIEDFLKKEPTWKDQIDWKAISADSDRIPDADLVLQMTSLGMKEDDPLPVDPKKLKSDAIVLEAVYSPVWTKFRNECKALGIKTVDGRAMLVGQGAVSFKIWTGVDADQKLMLEAIT